MIAFRVSLNGKSLCTAGVRDFGVLSMIVSIRPFRIESSKSTQGLDLPDAETASPIIVLTGPQGTLTKLITLGGLGADLNIDI